MIKWLVLVVTVVSATATQAAERALPFGEPGWELQGERTAIARDDGRDVLRVETGFAHRRDVRLQDGRIDFDVQTTRRRSFVYCTFRMVSDEEHEEIYLRPHKSNLPDAAQYAPVYQGRSGWQLYHGPGKTAAIDIQPGAWTHVRLLLQGPHAALFVGDMNRPAMVMRLAREPRPGYIALGGFLPAGVPGEGPIARFANVVISDENPSFDFAAALPPTAAPHPGVVRAWAVSPFFAPTDAAGVPALPDTARLGGMKRIDAGADGLVELHQVVPIPKGSRATAALARVHVRTSQAAVHPFDLGFSDIATVYLNGRPVFRGDGTYAFDRPRREGLIGYDQARLYLSLVAGDNELAVVVSDVFGGWGLMGRFASPEGLQIEAR